MSKPDSGFQRSRNRRWSEQGVPEGLLVQRARNGDPEAFDAIVARYAHHIYALAYLMIGNAEDARDLTRECFVRAYRSLSRSRGDVNFQAWLHRIAANACLDVLRKRKRKRWTQRVGRWHESLLPALIDNAPESKAIAIEHTDSVRRVLGTMNDRHRLALILREYLGLSTTEIGDVMGLSRSAVRPVLFRAREEFRSLYSTTIGELDAG